MKQPTSPEGHHRGHCHRCGQRMPLDASQPCLWCAQLNTYTQLVLPGFEAPDRSVRA